MYSFKDLINKIINYTSIKEHYDKLSFIDEIKEGVKDWRLFQKRN